MAHRRKIALLAAMSALTVAAAPAAGAKDLTVTAQRAAEDRLVERVSYRDLNLVAAAGQRTLERRVRKAAHNVCAPLFSGGADLDYFGCRNLAWDGAEPQIARAIERAHQIAATGRSDLPDVAIAISASSALR